MSATTLAYMCLALNIYYEAGTEPTKGQLAVALVTINRTYESRESVCDIVFKPKQFSWTNNLRKEDGVLKFKLEPIGQNWRKAKRIAKSVLKGEVIDFTCNSTMYYADYIKAPKWDFSKLSYTGKWGAHYFFNKKKNGHKVNCGVLVKND